MSNDTYDLDKLADLAAQLSTAKLREETTKQQRISVEEQIAALVPGPEKGQKTVKLPDGTKIVVERGLNYKADCQAIEKIFASEGETRFVPVKTKTTRELDEKGYEWYFSNDPDGFALLSKYVTVTPKKVAVSLKAK